MKILKKIFGYCDTCEGVLFSHEEYAHYIAKRFEENKVLIEAVRKAKLRQVAHLYADMNMIKILQAHK